MIDIEGRGLVHTCRVYSIVPVSVLLGIVLAGCSMTRHQTLVAGGAEELKGWTRYDVLWVETVTGERIEFPEEHGRIEASRNRETSLVEFFVIGTDSVGNEHRLNAQNLALINTRWEQDDPVATIGVILLGATVVGGILLFSSSPLF